jgi:hypothetical protein
MSLKLYQITGNFATDVPISNLYVANDFREAFRLAEIDGLKMLKKYVRVKAGEDTNFNENFELKGKFLN